MKNIQFLTFNVVFEPEQDGGYSVSVPALPGCFSQGDNFEDALKNIKEAISLHNNDLINCRSGIKKVKSEMLKVKSAS